MAHAIAHAPRFAAILAEAYRKLDDVIRADPLFPAPFLRLQGIPLVFDQSQTPDSCKLASAYEHATPAPPVDMPLSPSRCRVQAGGMSGPQAATHPRLHEPEQRGTMEVASTSAASGPGHRFVVGCALLPKKIRRYLTEDFVQRAQSRGIELQIIDRSRPLEEQGPFHVILHKVLRPVAMIPMPPRPLLPPGPRRRQPSEAANLPTCLSETNRFSRCSWSASQRGRRSWWPTPTGTRTSAW